MKWDSIKKAPGGSGLDENPEMCIKRRGKLNTVGTPQAPRASEKKRADRPASLLPLTPQQRWSSVRKHGDLSDLASCILHGVCRDPADSGQGAVYQSHSLAPRTERLWKPLPKRTWESNRRNGMQPCKTRPSHFATSVSSQTSAVEEMTVSRRQRPQEWIQPHRWKQNENWLIMAFHSPQW